MYSRTALLCTVNAWNFMSTTYLFLQVSTQYGTTCFSSPFTPLSWHWFGLSWRTMIKHQRTTLWDSSLSLSPVFNQVRLHSTKCIKNVSSVELLLILNKPVLFFLIGYRHIHLLSKDGTSIPPSSLFVHTRITKLT